MKTLILSSALALGLIFTGSVQAGTVVYNSKTTQNISHAPASGGAFNGAYLSSKAGSHLVGPSQEEGYSVAVNATYNTKTMRLVAFAPSFETSHLNSRAIVSSDKNNVQSDSDVAMR